MLRRIDTVLSDSMVVGIGGFPSFLGPYFFLAPKTNFVIHVGQSGIGGDSGDALLKDFKEIIH